MTDLGNLYEEKVTIPGDTFEVIKGKAKEKEVKYADKGGVKSGPENASGVKDIIDPKKNKKENAFEPEKFSSQNYKKTQKTQKIQKENINTFMNKSIFDELYEAVLGDESMDSETHDAEALGLPSGDEKEVTAGDDEVTITLSKELAGKLHDALMAVLGSDEEQHKDEDMDASEDGADDEESGEEDAEGVSFEATEIKELPSSVDKVTKVGGKNNQVDGDVTKSLKDGSEGDLSDGHTKNDPEPKKMASKGADKPTGKSNVVAGKVSSGVGKYVAGLK